MTRRPSPPSRPPWRALIALTTLALWTLICWPALAQPRTRVALAARAEDALTRQVTAELHAQGFEVARVAPLPQPADPAQLARAAASADADVIIAWTTTTDAVIVWARDPISSATSLRALTADPGALSADPREATRVKAFRVVEVLRVSLVELALPPAPPPAPPAPPADPERAAQAMTRAAAIAAPSRRRPPPPPAPWRVHLDASLTQSLPDPGPTANLELGLRWRFAPALALGLSARAALHRVTIEAPRGRAAVWPGALTLGLIWSPGDAPWSWPLELRAGLAWTHFAGQAQAPLINHDGALLGPTLALRAGARRLLSRHLAARADLTAALLMPAHEVRVAGDAAALRAWDLGLSLGLELTWDR